MPTTSRAHQGLMSTPLAGRAGVAGTMVLLPDALEISTSVPSPLSINLGPGGYWRRSRSGAGGVPGGCRPGTLGKVETGVGRGAETTAAVVLEGER
jgi:hypothetical protein